MAKAINSNTKDRLNGLQLVRFLCAIGIIVFHFECHFPNEALRFITSNIHVSMGGIFVYTFFMISGAVLFLNYNNSFQLKKYFYKRWKGIFILFYFVYIVLYIRNCFLTGAIFWGPQKWKIIFSVFGIDGFIMNHGFSTWYLTGEWFLGALIILYVIFPILLWLTKKFKYFWVFLIILLMPAYHFAIDTTFLKEIGIHTDGGTDLITAVFYFYVGMIFAKYKNCILKNKVLPFIVLPASLYFLLWNQIIWYSVSVFFVSVGCLLVFNFIGEYLHKNKHFSKNIDSLSKLTYPMFLLQHVIIIAIIQSFNPTSVKGYILFMIMAIVLTMFFAKISCVVEKSIKNSYVIGKLDNFFLK